MRPKYTIFIPVYNSSHLINNFCNNILRQIDLPDQILIVDDTMNSKNFQTDIKKKLSPLDKKVELTLIKNLKNLRPSLCWNRNINKFRNNLVFRMDADDFWNENHTSKMIDGYLLDKNNLLYAQTSKFKWSKLFLNNDLLFINPLIHSSCLFNLNICNFTYPGTNQPFDDLKAYIKIKYLLKKNIKILNFKTCKVNTTRSGRWSNQSKSFKKKEYLKKLFLLALKKKLNIKKINLITMFKLFYIYNIFQILFILYKIHQN